MFKQSLIKFQHLLRCEPPKRHMRCSIVPKLRIEGIPSAVRNEPVLQYLPGSKERCQLDAELKFGASDCVDVPIVIGCDEIRTKNIQHQVMPHDKSHAIARFYYADNDTISKAIQVAVDTQPKWDRVPVEEKLRIWEKAADLMANEYRQKLNTATILGQSKTIIQAEIDSAAELVDFFRFNALYLKQLLKYQPISDNIDTSLNSFRYRGLEGFVAAISPFNFTAIGGNLAYTPALMGCSVVWKPSDTAMLSNWTIFRILREAGMPAGVVNFVPADGPLFGSMITCSEHLAGINFTGSVPTFQYLWQQVGQNISIYKNFPRLVGECGGKNFHFIHPTANLRTAVAATLRSAFEYCGQKCSACSRMYVPESLWCQMKQYLLNDHAKIKVGDPTEPSVFMGAVIDQNAFDRITRYIEYAKCQSHLEIIAGGNYINDCGYFVEPTIIVTEDPYDKLMTEEIFGPVLTIYVYDDNCVDEVLDIIDKSTPYALTGAVFAENEVFLKRAFDRLRMTAGNFYINDKSTGSVVGQQPFGGSRMSGTNDKAGGPHYVLRWASPITIKETFVPMNDIDYPYMRAC